jgi:hypothetical protein
MKGLLNRMPPERDDPEPTVYLVIYKPGARKLGLSWTILIRMPKANDFIIEVIEKPHLRHPYYIVESNECKAVLNAPYRDSIPIGPIPCNTPDQNVEIKQVRSYLQNHRLHVDKPDGMSTIWLSEKLRMLRRMDLVKFGKGVDEEIEKRTVQMERELRAARAARAK